MDVRDDRMVLHPDDELAVFFCFRHLGFDPLEMLLGKAGAAHAALVVVERKETHVGADIDRKRADAEVGTEFAERLFRAEFIVKIA